MISPRNNLLAVTIGLAMTAPAVIAQSVFYENFDIVAYTPGNPGGCPPDWPGGAGTYPFPGGWLLRNVDNRTPNAQVSYVNDAWEDREDFNFNVSQCAAFSTSYYSPVGAADDWMWTPAVALPAGGAILSWRAVAYDPAYPDGYQVRVMTSASGPPTGGSGAIGNQVTNSTMVFSTLAEASTWTQHTVDLSAYVGQTVYVGFRNNSNDQYLLLIDDVRIMDTTPDAVATASKSYSGEYSRAPDGFSVDAGALGFTALNGGGVALTNVVGTATLELDGTPFGSPILSAPLASLAFGASAPITFSTGNTFSGTGQWSVQYSVSSDQSGSETNTANNVILSEGTAIGGNELARDEGSHTSMLGIGAGNGGEIGAAFTLLVDTTVNGIRFGMTPQSPTIDDGMGGTTPNPWAGLPLVANLRAFDTGTGKPGALIDTTVPVSATFEGGVYDVDFSTGAHALTAGTYVVTVSEPVFSGGAMSLPMYPLRFTAGTVWINWPTNPFGNWANAEQFGASFAREPGVSLLTDKSIFKDGFDVAVSSQALSGQTRAWRGPPTQAKARPSRKPLPTRLAAPQ